MATQNPLSLQIPIKPDKVKQLEAALHAGGPHNPLLRDPLHSKFLKMAHLHFSRFIIAPAATLSTGQKVPASLIYSANVDGTGEDHLRAFVKTIPEELDQILENCTGYPVPEKRDENTRFTYLNQFQVKTPAFYVGAPNRSVQQIREESQFHKDIQEFVKKKGSNWGSSKEAWKAIKAHIKENPKKWPELRKAYKLPNKSWGKLILFGLLLVGLLPWVAMLLLIIRVFYESKEKPFGIDLNQVSVPHLEKMKEQEDITHQNQLSQVFETKRGFRRLGLKFFFWTTNCLGGWFFVDGQLLNTPTIHFARWIMIDGGERFVFFSNFDGSHDMYLGDFVDNSGWGLNAIYGAAMGYPKTRFVFLKGAYQIGEFMGWGRTTQVETQWWYSAYPWEGLQQIVSRSQIRASLFNTSNPSEKEIEETLRRI